MGKKYIVFSSLVACIILYVVEQVAMADYLTKTLSKVFLFTFVPFLYIKFIKKTNISDALNLKLLDKKSLKLGLLFGIASFGVILVTYYILKDFIDFNSIVTEMEEKSNITPTNFLLVGTYITFGNSFLEEFFFRGFIFLSLYELGHRKFAYIYSSLLFAIYHIGIFQTWFNPWLIALALLGLVIVAFVFNWLNTKTRNFLNSWIVHILADMAIIFIGMRLLKII